MVDRAEVTQMSKFMAALGGSPGALGGSPGDNTSPKTASDPAVNEMKMILERFHKATDHVINEASFDSELRESLVTEQTNHGARIGTWEIHNRPSGNRQLYCVVHSETGETLANDLMLYEAAHGLIRILNSGGHLNCREAVELLSAEQTYAASVQDMVLFRHRLTQQPDSRRTAILEARYGEAKRRAIQAKQHVQRLFGQS